MGQKNERVGKKKSQKLINVLHVYSVPQSTHLSAVMTQKTILTNIQPLSFFSFQDDKMLTLPSFQSAFARTRPDDSSFNAVTTSVTAGEKNIINHGLKPSASLFSPAAIAGNTNAFHSKMMDF